MTRYYVAAKFVIAAELAGPKLRRHIFTPDTYERILSDHLLDLRRKAIEPGPQIDRLAGEEHLRPRRQADHVAPFIARSTRDSAFSLTKASTLTRAPFGKAISIPPVLLSPGSRERG
ncbi:MAG: hypothetical protein ABSC06_38590, partial [Rhodopila sp.]